MATATASGFIYQQKVILVLGIVLLIGIKMFYEGRYMHHYMNKMNSVSNAETPKDQHHLNFRTIENEDSITSSDTAIGITKSKVSKRNMTNNIITEVLKLNSGAAKNSKSVATLNNNTKKSKINLPSAKMMNIPDHGEVSPACRPHFLVADHPDQPLKWSNFSKFKRLYFFHTRKAGGTSLKYYMERVAKHHGLQFATHEYEGSEVPGSSDVPTFYVTHLREPISRSISHFKYEGRWDCNQLTKNMTEYDPSEENANKLESWYENNDCLPCFQLKDKQFYLVKCAANCYMQWFSKLSCPSWNVPISIQVEKARAVLHRFNIVIVLEKLRDPTYVSAVEKFFGVPGITETRSAWCERESHFVNSKFPLQVKNSTLQLLSKYNEIDIALFNNISGCLADGVYDFPKWDGDRFVSDDASRVHHTDFPQWKKGEIRRKKDVELQKGSPKKDYTKPSPACRPHFESNNTKFKRLYFYHSRKAGGSSLRYYFEKVAKHHGLEYAVTEYEKAEDPGSRSEDTLYVTNIREPVSRSISGFKYEGRWECNQLIYNHTFVPSEENAKKIDTWIHTGGHDHMTCKYKEKNKPLLFFLGGCAINCFIQWFAGVCPREAMPWARQYEIAEKKLLQYNFIVVVEKLKDPTYVSAVEAFFGGVPGLTKKKSSLCEPVADKSNKLYPLVIKNDTLANLRNLNKFDIMLYERLTGCLKSGQYNFPKWNVDRFHYNYSIQISHEDFDKWTRDRIDENKAKKIANAKLNKTG